MTTKEATLYLNKSKPWLYSMARKGKLRHHVGPDSNTDWDDDDVMRMKVLLDYGVEHAWDWAKQYTVIYCRAEPAEDLRPASKRLIDQKERMVRFSQGRGLDADLILAEVRPVLRFGMMSADQAAAAPPTALQSLYGLIGQRKVRTLIIETRDRLAAVESWLAYEGLLRAYGVHEIVVANSVWPTQEQRSEAKSWMADLLVRYKVLAGEIRDQRTVDTFMKGFDPKATFLAAAKIEARLTQREKAKKRPQWSKLPPEKRVLDLDDCWQPDSGTT